MAIFNSYVKLPEGISSTVFKLHFLLDTSTTHVQPFNPVPPVEVSFASLPQAISPGQATGLWPKPPYIQEKSPEST